MFGANSYFAMFSRAQPKKESKLLVTLNVETNIAVLIFSGPPQETEALLSFVKTNLFKNGEVQKVIFAEEEGVKTASGKVCIDVDKANDLRDMFCFIKMLGFGIDEEDFLKKYPILYVGATTYGQNVLKIYNAIQVGNQMDPSLLPCKSWDMTQNQQYNSRYTCTLV